MIAIYGDVHLTKKMGTLQSEFNSSSIRVFEELYRELNNSSVDFAVCLGDFFDAPRLEARSVRLVTTVLSIINNSKFPTYFLLGNHEIFDEDSNILEFLSEYENIIPVTELLSLDKFLFVPYSVKLEDISEDLIDGRYLFTHHDIYGSSLAGGKVRASFGANPDILCKAKVVFNGHVHLDSTFGNIINAGSLLKTQQGELLLGKFPLFYRLDAVSGDIKSCPVERYFIAPFTIEQSQYEKVLEYYHETVKFIFRVEYTGELSLPHESLDKEERVLRYRLRRDIKEDSLESKEVKKKSIDIKEMVSSYIRRDPSVLPENKEPLIIKSLELLGAQL